jgi:hypothetical protein
MALRKLVMAALIVVLAGPAIPALAADADLVRRHIDKQVRKMLAIQRLAADEARAWAVRRIRPAAA